MCRASIIKDEIKHVLSIWVAICNGCPSCYICFVSFVNCLNKKVKSKPTSKSIVRDRTLIVIIIQVLGLIKGRMKKWRR